jgi:hypothetical protein
MSDQPNYPPPGGSDVPPQPGYPPPGYTPQPGYPPPQGGMPPLQPGMPGPMYLAPPTSGMAIASLVIGIASFLVLPLVGHILALVFGYMARNEIKASNGRVAGDGYATAGIILGYIGIGLSVLAVVFIIIFIATAAAVVHNITFPTPTPELQHIFAPRL